MKLFRILDPFTATLVTVVLLASFFPARGAFVPFFEHLTTAAIALLLFMHGAKLSREAIIAGGSHWRLHLWVMCSTFILFPVLGVLFAWWAPVKVDPMLYSGFIYLCILPATVQSAIAFTSLAGGNVAAAVCSASASSLLGIFVSPLLVGVLMNLHGAGGSLEQVGKIMLQLLLPFVLGHLSRPWIGNRHRTRRRQAPGFFNHNPDLIVRHGQENQKALLINMVGGPRERRRGVELHIRHHKMQRIVMTAKADPGQLPDGAGRAVGADNIVISGGTGPTGIVEQGDVIALPLPPPGDQLVPAFYLPPGGG